MLSHNTLTPQKEAKKHRYQKDITKILQIKFADM